MKGKSRSCPWQNTFRTFISASTLSSNGYKINMEMAFILRRYSLPLIETYKMVSGRNSVNDMQVKSGSRKNNK